MGANQGVSGAGAAALRLPLRPTRTVGATVKCVQMIEKLKPLVAPRGAREVDKHNGLLFAHFNQRSLAMRPRLILVLTAASVALATVGSRAQCCGAPTVAYSPVVAPAPVVTQTTVSNGWYPGKYLTDFTRNLFGYGTTTTYATNYAPYTAGYAPTYSVGYAPSYSAGYAPTLQTAYRPTYPATYGVVNYAPLVQEVARPVVLSPVVAASACDACGGCGACDACSGGVAQAYFAGPSTGCAACSAGTSFAAPLSSESSLEPQPALAPTDNPPVERSIRQRPEIDSQDDTFDELDSGPTADPAAANDYWGAPPLFAPPANRVTRGTHPAPVQTAVYRRPVAGEPAAFRGQDDAAPTKAHRLSASGWASAAD